MKKFLSGFVIMIFCCRGFAQNNQIKLYIQQIAANAVYLEYLQKGYSIAHTGLQAISQLKEGHFNLDKDFFSQLDNINPRVLRYAKVADIVALNVQIIKRYKNAIRDAQEGDWFTEKELRYFDVVFDKVAGNCGSLVDELIMLMTPRDFKMSDDERIRRIDQLYNNMQDDQTFVEGFSADLARLKVQRVRDKNDVDVLSGLYK